MYGREPQCGQGISSATALTAAAQVAQHLVGRRVAGGTGHPASGVHARAAEVEPADRHPEARPARHGTHEEELLECQVAMEDVALGEAVGALEVERSEDLHGAIASGTFGAYSPIVLDDLLAERRRALVPGALTEA